MEIKLGNEHLKIFNNVLVDSPIFSDSNLACFKVGSEIMFNSPILSKVTINTFAVLSGEQIFYDVVRKDKGKLDVDRRLMSLGRMSASGAFIQTLPIKNFEWHHNPPSFYLS